MNADLKGLIFDIRRFSTHDGAGIRTTVFLKGCPLRCVWCQNPEGISAKPQLVHFANACILCGMCTKLHDQAAVIEDGKLRLNALKVQSPEEYVAACPSGALRMDSRQISVAETLAAVLRDRPFFRHGGGVTLSGGEPFMQPDFTLALLKGLKEEGIHTAVETSLFANSEHVRASLPYIDTLFADLKAFDASLHEKYTGISPALILQNIALVLRSEYRGNVVIRTPLIPKHTATRENVAAIADYIAGLYPEVQYELLNYNPLAKAKYAYVDFTYCFAENPPLYTKTQMDEFYEIARLAGIKNCIVEG